MIQPMEEAGNILNEAVRLARLQARPEENIFAAAQDAQRVAQDLGKLQAYGEVYDWSTRHIPDIGINAFRALMLIIKGGK